MDKLSNQVRNVGNAREYSLNVIKEKLINLELEPGTLISEKELADELHVSRTPVREALIHLSKSKIITIIPQKGCYIQKIDYELVDESQFIRLQLEKGIIEEICRSEKPMDLTGLEENLKLQEFYMNLGDLKKFFELDNQYHELFYELTGKYQTFNLIEIMLIHFSRVRRMKLETENDVFELYEDHEHLLHAIKEKNVKKALNLLEHHLTRYQINKTEIEKKYKHYF